MGARRRSDPGLPGTARWLRRFAFNGITQRDFARLCGLRQAQVSAFERGRAWLTDAMARRIAQAFPEFQQDPDRARLRVYRVWLANVEAAEGQDAAFLREARDYVARVTSMLPGELWTAATALGYVRDVIAAPSPGKGAREA